MAIVKRHWKMFLLSSILSMTVFVGGMVWLNMGVSDAVGQLSEVPPEAVPVPAENYASLDASDFATIQVFRRDLSLRDEDLAAMGCSSEQATTILVALRNWCEVNKESHDTACRLEAQSVRNLRRAHRQKNIGVSEGTAGEDLPELKSDYAEAIELQQQIKERLISHLSSLLSTDQLAIWEASRMNHALPIPLRYATGLTASDAESIRRAIYVAARRSSSEGLSVAIDGLSGTQKTQSESALRNMQAYLPGILEVSEQVLPIPEELKQPESR